MSAKYLEAGSVLGNRYIIVRLLGEGGMGAVYQATDQRLGKTVALKVTDYADEEFREQFVREACLLASLRHKGLPDVTDLDYFPDENIQCLVMEYIAGDDLKSLLDQSKRPFPYEEVLGWGGQLLDVLCYLHSQQPPVIHRDIKPQNLKRNNEGQVILLDFGLAKGAVRGMKIVTEGNTLPGCTPYYAPLEQEIRVPIFMPQVATILSTVQFEQIASQRTDARTDLYSLAATLYHLMTGAHPPMAIERFAATYWGQPDPLRSANEICPDVPLDVALFLKQAMAISRDKRFASATAMRKALEQAKTPPQPPPIILDLKPVARIKKKPDAAGAADIAKLEVGMPRLVTPHLTPRSQKDEKPSLNPHPKIVSVKEDEGVKTPPQPPRIILDMKPVAPLKQKGIGDAETTVPEATSLRAVKLHCGLLAQKTETTRLRPTSAARKTVGKSLRVYELAKELNLESKHIIDAARREGVNIYAPASSIPYQVAERIREKYRRKQPPSA